MNLETLVGVHGDWEFIGRIQVRSQLSIADTSYFFDEPLVVPISSGDYAANLRYVFPHGHQHIGQFRLAAVGLSFSRGGFLGNVRVDFGQIGISDRCAVEAAFDSLGDSGMTQYYDQLNTTALTAWVKLPGSVEMLILRPGYGDGSYPVCELVGADGVRAGIEIDFLHSIK